ncbi:MAG: CaiB/BaiF CoA-transferase family protein [Gemmatimonadaceae bacterium]
MTGPLEGMRVVEMVGIGPAPFCGMMLADLGADVIRVDRPTRGSSPVVPDDPRRDVMARNRVSLGLDLKQPNGLSTALSLIDRADALIEGFRPGAMERLGLGPDVCIGRNPKLVYGRMTGWGQYGPLAGSVGHDINYVAISGALHAVGKAGDKPTLPLNYVGDFAGGGMMLAVGILAAVLNARTSGKGQIIDAAMADGAALVSSMMYAFRSNGWWNNERGTNMLDGGAHFYDTYACADGKFIALGAIEPQFYAALRERCELTSREWDAQMDPSAWPVLKEKLTALFATRSRDAWCELLEGSDACVAPVLDWDEAPTHPHNVARGTFVEVDGVMQPAPAPRFSRTPLPTPRSAADSRISAADAVARWATDDARGAR